MQEIITKSAEETQRFGENWVKELIRSVPKKECAVVIALEGDLGSGKTTFVQGMAKGLSIKQQITSPSFVLIKKYDIPKSNSQNLKSNFYHMDCYRLEKSWQLQELGFEEIINNPENLVAIEWAERVTDILPEGAIKIRFEYTGEDERRITIT